MDSENQLSSPCNISYSQFSLENKHGDSHQSGCYHCCKRHCFKGYFWAVVGSLCFFVVFPGGILLIIHGHFKGTVLTLCLGVLVLALCICILPGAYIWLHHWRRKRARRKRMRRAAMNAIKEQAAVANYSALITQSDGPSSGAC